MTFDYKKTVAGALIHGLLTGNFCPFFRTFRYIKRGAIIIFTFGRIIPQEIKEDAP